MKTAFYTLGCKVNQTETDALKTYFTQNGHEVVPSDAYADVYIVNSCTVTAQGDAKSRRWLNHAKRQNPNAVTVLCGCFAQAFPQKAADCGADIVAGTQNRVQLLALIEDFFANKEKIVQLTPHIKGEVFEELPYAHTTLRTRAFVKIQDGCNRRCAYCIIPTARGAARSRKKENILSELAALANEGYKEAVLTGINLSSYGCEGGIGLVQLIEDIAAQGAIERIRIGSLEPDLLSEEDLERLAAIPQLCRQFHLSLQSGCGETLKRMRRPYTTAQFAVCAKALRSAMPNAMLTTDVIVGFPGESEEEFTKSLEFVKEMRFLKVHVFPFSAREGTAAAAMGGQILKKEKDRRVAAMQTAADAVRHAVICGQKDTLHNILLEAPLPNGLFTGYTENYIPVNIIAPNNKNGDIITACLGNFNGKACVATLIPGINPSHKL